MDAPLEYINHGEKYLSHSLASLLEFPSKINFCKQRKVHADKLMKLVPGGSQVKQKEQAEELLAEHMKSADAINQDCNEVC